MGTPVQAVDAQLVLQGLSGLPEDRYVMTSSWICPGGITGAQRDEIADKLTDFLTTSPDGTLSALTDFLSPATSDFGEIRLYDHGAAEPREPTIYDVTVTSTQSSPLPNEVALCLSYFSDRNIPTQRGRIYFGPLGSSTAVIAIIGGESRPTVNLRESLAGAGAKLAAVGTTGVQWCVWSRKTGGLLPITDGWVDDSWDTQRRRGVDPTSRIAWVAL